MAFQGQESQRRRRHFKSGQATANKRLLVNVHGGWRVYNRPISVEKQNYCKQRNSPYFYQLHVVYTRVFSNTWAPKQLVWSGGAMLPIRREKSTKSGYTRVSLCGIPGPIVPSSDCLCSLGTKPTTHLKSCPALAGPARLATPPLHEELSIIKMGSFFVISIKLPCFSKAVITGISSRLL